MIAKKLELFSTAPRLSGSFPDLPRPTRRDRAHLGRRPCLRLVVVGLVERSNERVSFQLFTKASQDQNGSN